MKTILFTILLAFTARAAAADVAILDNDQTVTVDCAKDKTVNITGNKATVTLTGVCDQLMISGNHATVKGSVAVALVSGNNNALVLDQIDRLTVSGNKNTVSYKKAVKAAASTKILATGKDNKISQEK